MDISALRNVSSEYIQAVTQNKTVQSTPEDESFGAVFQSALNMIGETNELQNTAESAEIQFALGESENTHDLQVAQEQANIALQYTVAVRDRALESYRDIMNMSM